MREMPVKRGGQITGANGSQMLKMLSANVKAAHALLSFDNAVCVVGDEINRRRRHHYTTEVPELKAKKVFFAPPGKGASVLGGFRWGFGVSRQSSRGDPACVHLDQSRLHHGVSYNLGNSRVGYDKLHVIQNLVETCDKVGKAETRLDSGRGYLAQQTSWMWIKSRMTWTEKEPLGSSWWP